MQKKDFEAAAFILRNAREQLVADHRSEDEVAVIDRLALDWADAVEEENPNFDRGRFLKACGVIS